MAGEANPKVSCCPQREHAEYVVGGRIESCWCDGCMTSAAYTFTLYALSMPYPGQPRVVALHQVTSCENCNPEQFAEGRGGDAGVLV